MTEFPTIHTETTQYLIIFDIDGTLLYTDKQRDSKAFAETYEDLFGKPFPTIDWKQYPHVTDTTIFDTVFQKHFSRSVSVQEQDKFEDQYIDRLLDGRTQFPERYFEVQNAIQNIQHLQEQTQVQLGIATGGWKRPQEVKLQHLGLDPSDFFTSYADGQPTREDILNDVLTQAKATGHAPDHIVYIGDAIWDVRTTFNLQMNFIGIRHKGDLATLLEAGASQVYQSYPDPITFWQALQSARPPIKTAQTYY